MKKLPRNFQFQHFYDRSFLRLVQLYASYLWHITFRSFGVVLKSIFTVSIFSLTLSCTTIVRKEPPKKAQPSQEQRLKLIHKELKTNSWPKAIEKLETFINENSDTDLADDASVLGGRFFLARKDYDRAFSFFMNIVNSRIYSPIEGEALMLAADALLKLGRFDEGLALTRKGLEYRDLPKDVELSLYELRYKIQTQLGDRLDAFATLVQLSQLEKDRRKVDAYKLKALDYLESTLSEEELYQVARSRSFGDYRAEANLRLGESAFEKRQFDRAKDYFENAYELGKGSDVGEKANSFLFQIEARRTVDPKTIGAVLPLSGRHAAIAEKTLQGLQLGLGIFGKEKSSFKLAIIDSEGNPDAARRAVERLVTEDHVIAIVGSLLSRTAVAVASKANELGVPNIALSQKSGITEIGDYVYRNALTSEMQVSELVRVAMEERGFKRFAVLFPNDKYGVEYANLFWNHVQARGGVIAGAQSYDPKETDFSGPISRLVGKFYLEDRLHEYKLLIHNWFEEQKVLSLRVSPPDDLIKPIVDFDAIFIPDSTRALGQIAPMLAYHDIEGPTLLGTNLWNTPSLVRRGQKFVEGALFVDSLFANDKKFQNSEFFREFYRTYGEKPGIFESQGYDAGLLLRQLILNNQNSRIAIKESLDKITNFPGSLGHMETSTYREISRPVVKLGVQSGQIVIAPNSLAN